MSSHRVILYLLLVCWSAAIVTSARAASDSNQVVVGSKKFTESYILAEIMAQLLEDRGFVVTRNTGLGGTLLCYEALRTGAIDVYPEYSGTVEQAILKSPERLNINALKTKLAEETNVQLLDTFGFNNTYAIALTEERAAQLSLKTIGDLAGAGELRMAFSHEFLNRADGWPGLARAYRLEGSPNGIEHGLAYEAIEQGKIDVTDVYSTDGDIEKYHLALLDDDRGYFPTYLAAPFIHNDVTDSVRRVLGELSGRITADEMRRLNARVLLHGDTFGETAREFLLLSNLVSADSEHSGERFWPTLFRRTLTHLKLTLIALLAAMLIAIPLGVLIYHVGSWSHGISYITGMLQTIPSIALLAFMIPLFGIGAVPAIVALFLYALLPIVRNTTTALFSIDPVIKRVAVGMGLTPAERIRRIELPLAAATILTGIKTAAVINIGTATLAAFIGAGGLGEPIVTGLALNDTNLILQGAIPAAVLAIIVELLFEIAERLFIPKHLLAKRAV